MDPGAISGARDEGFYCRCILTLQNGVEYRCGTVWQCWASSASSVPSRPAAVSTSPSWSWSTPPLTMIATGLTMAQQWIDVQHTRVQTWLFHHHHRFVIWAAPYTGFAFGAGRIPANFPTFWLRPNSSGGPNIHGPSSTSFTCSIRCLVRQCSQLFTCRF